ncbi:cell death regulator Aven-like [Lingula anatina]|uniref:Cell death regulator Aven-like n=1 Tax=Lingula anatina TaxID=7574 RepID=A0A1S3JW73_LINAN|nr:cell death regulator Aven-like [Lingula anatina]|eukprot:XP_013414289.1 cell death regulator Aven-like [Lingula anatina]
MRPDEHKKKRSSQYKKSHPKVANKKNHGQDVITGNKGERNPKIQAQHGSLPVVDKLIGGADIHVVENKHEYPKRTIQRKIESSWNSYEIEEDDPVSDGLRGTDFQILISANDSSDSQFRLKDEKDWEEEEGIACIAIDCNNIAAALQCVPLYKRLNIEKSLFEEEQLKQIEESARLNADLYKQDNNFRPSVASQRTETLNIKDNAPGLNLQQKDKIYAKTTATGNDCPIPDNNTKISSENLEEDLDYLLSLDVPNKTDQTLHKDGTKCEDGTNLEDWLDSVLDD